MILTTIAALLGPILWAIRGGLWGEFIEKRITTAWGTTVARIVTVVIPMSALSYLATDNLWLLLVGPSLFLGVIPGWCIWFDMGRVHEDNDLQGMTWRGLMLHAPTGLLLECLGFPHTSLLIVLGAMLGPIYWASWRWVPFVPGDYIHPTRVAEYVTGAWVFGLIVGVIQCGS